MKTYSSSVIKLFSDHCPAALGFYEAGAPRYDDLFQTGIAAHHVLEHCGKKDAKTPDEQATVGDAVVFELITAGRTYRGSHEPPMQPEAALAGRDIALRWLAEHPHPAGAQFELELFTPEVGGIRYAALIDRLHRETIGDEDDAIEAVITSDYKTAWPVGAEWLESLQAKGQAVVAWLNYPNVDAIITETINLRTWAVYSNTIRLDEDGVALLTRWHEDIKLVCRAVDQTREARPGIGCADCPYILGCSEATRIMCAGDEVGQMYAIAKGRADELGKQLRVQTKEQPLNDGNGGWIGYQPKTKRRVHDEAAVILTDDWFHDLDPGVVSEVRGLIRSFGPLSVKAVENCLKVNYNGRENKAMREDLLDQCTESYVQPEFTTWKA